MNDFDENLICLNSRTHIENDEEKDKETDEETDEDSKKSKGTEDEAGVDYKGQFAMFYASLSHRTK